MKLKTKFQDEDFELGEVADVNIATMPDGRIKAIGYEIKELSGDFALDLDLLFNGGEE